MQLQTVVWLFYGGFEVMAFSSQSNLSARGGTGLVLLWTVTLSNQFQPASSQGLLLLIGVGADLHISHQKTFLSVNPCLSRAV